MRVPDNDLATMWYKQKSNPAVIDMLWCHACRTNEAKIIGMINYSSVWISGSTNHKTGCVIDHANRDQHKAAIKYARKASGVPIFPYCLRCPKHGQNSTGTH